MDSGFHRKDGERFRLRAVNDPEEGLFTATKFIVVTKQLSYFNNPVSGGIFAIWRIRRRFVMTAQTIAIISPGELGSAVGGVLRENGFEALACLSGRSALTRERALAAGFRDVPTLEALLEEADLVLSIMPPACAVDAAREVAAKP